MGLAKQNDKPLGKFELIAIALGGMIGGGIFSILGVSVDLVGSHTPIAIFIGGVLAFLAAYSYAKLSSYYKDEGATYSFFKKTFPKRKFAISYIGWLIIFGYISTLALYAYTFASYFSTLLPTQNIWQIKIIALIIISIFATINLISVNGMGKIEDIMVYTKVAILLVISGLFLRNGNEPISIFQVTNNFSVFNILTVAAITFVAFEGFQLVIHAYEEAENPEKNVPKAIYWSILATTLIYIVLALGAIHTIPKELLVRDKEFALAAGASKIIGNVGYFIVLIGALLATSSAINGTLFGASRLMAVISKDGVFPKVFSHRVKGHIPNYAIVCMSIFSFIIILTGGLQQILEFGSITFIVVSCLMAISNFKIRNLTNSNYSVCALAITLLSLAAILILIYEANTNFNQLLIILSIYGVLAFLAYYFSKKN